MKVAIVGDTHLGFAYGTPRQEDSFRNAKDAIKKALEGGPDMIIQLGDMFHERIPKPEVLAPGIEIFSHASSKLKPIKIFQRVRKGKEEQMSKEIPAVLTIFGNHERRAEHYVNPVQIVERSKAVYCMTAESIVVEANGERIGIHGLSAVPGAVFRDVMASWNPKPFPRMQNIMILHQTFKDVIPQIGDEAPSFADLPTGFDAYFCGDIHWRVEDQHPSSKAPIIIAGSTVKTQLKKLESTQKKGIYIANFADGKIHISLKTLETPRDFTYEAINVGGKKPGDITSLIDADLDKKLKYHVKGLKPLIRYKLNGKLADGFLPTDLNFRKLIQKYEKSLLVFIDKTKVESTKLAERSKFLADLKNKRVSIDQRGLEILSKRLGIKDTREIEGILHALGDGDLNKARGLLT